MIVADLATFVLLVVLGLVGVVVAWMLVAEYGHPALDNYRSRCPQCTGNGLMRIDNGEAFAPRRQLRSFHCRLCNASYREELDGTLTKM